MNPFFSRSTLACALVEFLGRLSKKELLKNKITASWQKKCKISLFCPCVSCWLWRCSLNNNNNLNFIYTRILFFIRELKQRSFWATLVNRKWGLFLSIYLDATKFVLLSNFSFIETNSLKIWAKPLPKNAQGVLPVQRALLKNVSAQAP